MDYNRVLTTFSKEELEQIETYAATRGIKKATAVKELAIRGLELNINNAATNDLYNFIYNALVIEIESLFDANWFLRIQYFINTNNYSELLHFLESHVNKHYIPDDVKEAIAKCINESKVYTSSYNMNNYPKNR